jgi:phosphohistidine phosphatase SixA
MHELILLRHAETMSSAPDGSDHARPLSAHGEAEARAAGRWLAEHGAAPGRVLCSPAQRTLMTAREALPALDPCPLLYVPEIYDATPGDLLELLDRNDDAEQVLLIGHNPGIERLVALLVEGRSQEYRGMPPAALAWLHLDDSLEPGTARVHAFWSP